MRNGKKLIEIGREGSWELHCRREQWGPGRKDGENWERKELELGEKK